MALYAFDGTNMRLRAKDGREQGEQAKITNVGKFVQAYIRQEDAGADYEINHKERGSLHLDGPGWSYAWGSFPFPLTYFLGNVFGAGAALRLRRAYWRLCRNYYELGDETIDIVSRCNRPVLRFVFDLYHQQINEGNLIANLRRTCDRAGAIHFADVPGRGAPGTGEINMASIWRELVSLGYDGVIGFETVPGIYTTEETLAKLKEIFPWPASTNS